MIQAIFRNEDSRIEIKLWLKCSISDQAEKEIYLKTYFIKNERKGRKNRDNEFMRHL